MYVFLNRALLPHIVFWVLLGAGWWLAELSNRQIAIFIALWLVTITVVSSLPGGGLWMTAVVALTDIALILMVFKGDIRFGR